MRRGMTVGAGREVIADCHPERRRSRREGSWVQVNGKTPRGARRDSAALGVTGFLATLGMTGCGRCAGGRDSSLRSE
jgi:hypothetical protein